MAVVERLGVHRVETRPVLAVVRNVVQTGAVAGQRPVRARIAPAEEVVQLDIIRQAVAVGIVQILAVEIEDHAAGRTVFLTVLGDHSFKEVRSVDKSAVENFVHAALAVASGEGGFEFSAADGILRQGQLLVAIPEKFDVAGRDALAGRDGYDRFEEWLRDRRAARVVDGYRRTGSLNREVAGERGRVDCSPAGSAIGFGPGERDRICSGRKTIHGDAPAALDHLVGLLGWSAVDRVGQVMQSAIGIFHRDNTGTFNRFALVQIDKSQIGSAAVDVDRGGESLVESGPIGSAAVEKARLNCVQALRDAGEIGHDLVVTSRDPGHLFVTTIDDIFAGDVGRQGV